MKHRLDDVTFTMNQRSLDQAAKDLSTARGVSYPEAIRLIHEYSPKARETVDKIMLGADEPPARERLDAAGHARLAPGQDPDKLARDDLQAARDWRAVRELGRDCPYPADDAGKAAFLTDRLLYLESGDGGRDLVRTLKHQAARREARTEGLRRQQKEADAERVREAERRERKRADDDRLRQRFREVGLTRLWEEESR
jgi:hypothetical protein